MYHMASYDGEVLYLQNTPSKLNHVVRLIFFATAYGPNTVSALPLLNLLHIYSHSGKCLSFLCFETYLPMA